MKTLKYLILIAALGFSTSCKKATDIDIEPISSVSIVNAINGANALRINKNTVSVNNNGYSNQAVDPSDNNIKAYDVTSNTVYYNQQQSLINGGLYSLYLTGTIAAPEGFVVKDNIKPYGTENTTTTVRVVNLSPNAGTVNVTLASAPTASVFSNVAYKTVAAFQDFSFPLTVPAGTNVFQFRDSAGTLLTSFTLPASARNRSYTIVLKGLIGGAGTQVIGAFGQTHY